ncbi:MAG TPA: Maf family protein [Candidatus Acidoferrales bacterium]|nr:Maf family protein [Candidatus Acidoferrales bacterium]
MSQKFKLILASASPRRAEILRNAGFDFEVVPAHVDESLRPGEAAADYVLRLAQEKARVTGQQFARTASSDSAIVIAADTVVVIDSEILGKPSSSANAREMLLRLSGKTHEVFTGLAVLHGNETVCTVVEKTRVTFEPLNKKEIEDYIGSGEPFDKAGAYAIQGRGGKFISRIEGCYFNVMGLPLARLYAILRDIKNTAVSLAKN